MSKENEERCGACGKPLKKVDGVTTTTRPYREVSCCEACGDIIEEDKDFGEIVAELISHGLNDQEILDQLVNGYGQHAPEYLVAHIRVIKRRVLLDPFPDGDLTTYLEMAKFLMQPMYEPMRMGVAEHLDMSEEEMDRLQKQLEGYLDGERAPEQRDAGRPDQQPEDLQPGPVG